MNTALTPDESTGLPSDINPSMLDGYLAAAASGPAFVIPDQVLRWVWPARQPAKQDFSKLIIRYYQAVNDALNDQTYVPYLADPQAWCRGYMDGVSADMMAWAPLTAAHPELLKAIMSGGGVEDLTAAARRIHAFWVAHRQQGSDLEAVQSQLAALSPGMPTQENKQRH